MALFSGAKSFRGGSRNVAPAMISPQPSATAHLASVLVMSPGMEYRPGCMIMRGAGQGLLSFSFMVSSKSRRTALVTRPLAFIQSGGA